MFFFTFSRSSLCNSLIISCLPFEIFCILQNICLILVVKESAYCCSGFPGFSLFPCLFIWCTRSITMFSAISSLSLMSDWTYWHWKTSWCWNFRWFIGNTSFWQLKCIALIIFSSNLFLIFPLILLIFPFL